MNGATGFRGSRLQLRQKSAARSVRLSRRSFRELSFLRLSNLEHRRKRSSLACYNFAELLWPPTMLRVQAILVIVAMLATPLALLARGMNGDPADCTSMCCLPHGHHAAQHKTMECEHGATGHVFECSMTSSHHTDYGLIAPIVPSVPLAKAAVAIPDMSRNVLAQSRELAAAGFLSALLQPPRI